MKKRLFTLFPIAITLLLSACVSPNLSEYDNDENNEIITEQEGNFIITETETEETSLVNGISKSSDKIYEYNDGINEYINNFNIANPDSQITSEMAIPYYHHGSEHKNQIQYSMNNFKIVITDGKKVVISYIPGNNHTNDEYKEMFKKYVRGFNNNLSDADLEENWISLMNDNIHNVKFDSYECSISIFSYKVELITIEKK